MQQLLLAAIFCAAALSVTAQERQRLVWDTGQRCFRPPEADGCGIAWNVNQRRYTGDTRAAAGTPSGGENGPGGSDGNTQASRPRPAVGSLGQGLDAEIRQQLEATAGAVVDAYTLGQAEGLARLIGESDDGPGGGPQARAIRQILQRANGNVDR